MKSENLTLSQDEIEKIKDELKYIITMQNSYNFNVKINNKNTNNNDAKKNKNLFFIVHSNQENLDLKIDLEKLSSLSNMDFQIKFNKFKIEFENTSEEKIKIKQNLYFSNCDFKAIELKNICFEKFEIDGYKYENDHKKSIVFNACEFKELCVKNSTFSEEIDFKEKTEIKYLRIVSSKFKKYFWMNDCSVKKTYIVDSEFKNKCFFLNSKFGNKDNSEIDEDYKKLGLYFTLVCFNESVFFENSVFYECAEFADGEFEKTVSFIGVTFYKIPNFYQVIFKGNLNTVNLNLNLTFNDLKIQTKEEYEKFLKDIEEQDKGSSDKFTNFFRDSFRVFKNALIKDNNLLEASNFHKYELYCKEIELEDKQDKTSKDVVDKYQLFFYRKLCDHHTDLLKVFHNLLIIIMLFSIFSFVLDKFKQPSIENNAKYHIVQVDTNESYIFKEHNKTTYNIFGLNINKESGKLDEFVKNNFVYVLILLFIVLSIFSFNIFTNLYIFGSFFYVIFNFLDLVALYTHIAIISLFVFFALKFILLDDKQEIIRKIIIGVSYIVCIFALLAKPSLMLPVFGSFLEKDTNATYPLLLSLSVVYFILVALVIFSLQKTARKNSIVPS
ncbi:hypothetical protein DR740_04745 [Campylobacter lari]|nr:hypothetical protein [Campylobacter lari]